MADETDGTEWLPSDWLDETFPALVEHPDKLVISRDGRWFVEHEESEEDEDEPGKFSYLFQVEPGQTVAFMGRRIYGDFAITLLTDGTWTGGGWPADATHFCHTDADWEAMAESIEKIISGDSFLGIEALSPGEHEITVWHWSDNIYWRFDVLDGQGRFVQVDDPNAISKPAQVH